MKRFLKIAMWMTLAFYWTRFMNLGTAQFPPLRVLAEMRAGVWGAKHLDLPDKIAMDGLEQPVDVVEDHWGIPHIFAENERDLFRVQGFLEAKQRSFQMQIMSRAVTGGLSEWAGSRTIDRDRFFIKLGVKQAAEKALEVYNQDPKVKEMLESFAAGGEQFHKLYVNYVPVEYRVLNQQPKPITPLQIAQIGRALTYSLSGRSFDTHLSKLQKRYGAAMVLDLFPMFFPKEYEDFVFDRRGVVSEDRELDSSYRFVTSLEEIPDFPNPVAGNGSNNWAVSGRKTQSGHSLLANDTHLNFTIPNIWYEVQLHTPEFNIYGVGLAGVPGIINGFNKDVSWGPTNGTNDAMDYYEVLFKDDTYERFLRKGQWKRSQIRMEELHVRGGSRIDIPVVETDLGFMVHVEGRTGLVAEWAGQRTGNELAALHRLWRSKNLGDCMAAFEQWTVPIQNFACADARDVGLLQVGQLSARRFNEGRFIMDGRVAEKAGAREWPEELRPKITKPRSGFVLSANQKLLPPGFEFNIGWDFEEAFRGMLIRRELEKDTKWTREDMVSMQNASEDLQAVMVLSRFLNLLDVGTLNSVQKKAVLALSRWDRHARAAGWETALYKKWFWEFKRRLFQDEVEDEKLYPKDLRTIWLMDRVMKSPNDSDGRWVDDLSTPDKETLGFQVQQSFQDAWKQLVTERGPDQRYWTWKEIRPNEFRHIARLPGLGLKLLDTDGSAYSISGNRGAHGAVYRLVVEMSNPPKALIQVPGGNEGDPMSPAYGRFLLEWSKGEMREAEFFQSLQDAIESESKARVVRFVPRES